MPTMVLCSDRMVQLLLPTSWLSQARGWYVQFQLRLAIDPISLVTQSCILLTALAAGGYLLHLRGALRRERRRGWLLQHRGRLQQRWASLAAALLRRANILVPEMVTPRWRPTAKSRGRALAAAMEPASKPLGAALQVATAVRGTLSEVRGRPLPEGGKKGRLLLGLHNMAAVHRHPRTEGRSNYTRRLGRHRVIAGIGAAVPRHSFIFRRTSCAVTTLICCCDARRSTLRACKTKQTQRRACKLTASMQESIGSQLKWQFSAVVFFVLGEKRREEGEEENRDGAWTSRTAITAITTIINSQKQQ